MRETYSFDIGYISFVFVSSLSLRRWWDPNYNQKRHWNRMKPTWSLQMTDAFFFALFWKWNWLEQHPFLILLQCIVWDDRLIDVRKWHHFQHASLYPIWASFLRGYSFTGFTRYISFMIFYSFYDDNYRCTESDFLWAFNMMNLFLRLTRSDATVPPFFCRDILLSRRKSLIVCVFAK